MSEPLPRQPRVDIQERLRMLLVDEIGGALLARAAPEALREVADDLVRRDLFDFPTFLAATVRALGLTEDPDGFAVRHVEHLLWVAHRRAYWGSGAARSAGSAGLSLQVEGEEHAHATAGQPTVLVVPMTLCHEDALWICHRISPERDLVIYGEGMTESDLGAPLQGVVATDRFRLVATGENAGVEIYRALREGASLLTYADFVYTGHRVERGRLLGVDWPFSAAFVALCARPGTLLLPCRLARADDRSLCAHFGPPIRVEPSGDGRADPRLLRRLIAATVGEILTAEILAEPHQWLLFSTLTAECRQRAS